MLKSFFGTISAFYNKNRVKSSHTHTVKEPSFGDEAFSKLSKEKRSEEHLINYVF